MWRSILFNTIKCPLAVQIYIAVATTVSPKSSPKSSRLLIVSASPSATAIYAPSATTTSAPCAPQSPAIGRWGRRWRTGSSRSVRVTRSGTRGPGGSPALPRVWWCAEPPPPPPASWLSFLTSHQASKGSLPILIALGDQHSHLQNLRLNVSPCHSWGGVLIQSEDVHHL
jgi:hypothetical protein